MKKIIVSLVTFFAVAILSLTLIDQTADAKTEVLTAKSTVNVLNIRQKPITTSKIVGKLKKNQSIAVKVPYKKNGFHEVVYKGKTAYISAEYSDVISPKNSWIGNYTNLGYTGSGVLTQLSIYKKTTKYIYIASHVGSRYDPTNGKLSGAEMPWEFRTYYGKATITSKNSASLTKGTCKMTLNKVGNSIRVFKKSGSCNSTYLQPYDGAYPYTKF